MALENTLADMTDSFLFLLVKASNVMVTINVDGERQERNPPNSVTTRGNRLNEKDSFI